MRPPLRLAKETTMRIRFADISQMLRVADPRSGARLCEAQHVQSMRMPINRIGMLHSNGPCSLSSILKPVLKLPVGWNRPPACCGGLPYLFTVLPTPVAQTWSLLYRRVALCQTSGNHDAWDRSDALPITNRRYSRLKICATVNRYGLPARRSFWRQVGAKNGLVARSTRDTVVFDQGFYGFGHRLFSSWIRHF